MKLPCTILAATLQLATIAAVPITWTATPASPPFAPPPVPHGSAVEFAVTLKGFTDPPIAQGADVRLWYQTNGMGSAWFSAPASLASNVVTASFGPAQDCGADRYALFFGAPSNVFASAVLRLTHAPGFVPSELSPPIQRLDFATVEIANAPYYTKAETEAKIAELAPAPGDYAAVSNAAMHSLQTRTEYGARHIDGDVHFTGGADFESQYNYFHEGFYFSGGESYRLYERGVETPSCFAEWPTGTGKFALTNDVHAAATAATNYTDEAIADFASTGTVEYAESAGSTSYATEAGSANRLYDADMENSYTADDFATRAALASAVDIARARHDYRWAAGQGVLYRIDFDADGYQYLTPVTNVNALAEGNEHILIHLEEQRHGNAD